MTRGDIVEDHAPALYLHEYSDADVTIRGVVGALDLRRRTDDPAHAAVVPHEGVHPAQARELAKRMREMRLNPAPILLTQRSPSEARRLLREVRAQLPSRQYLDRGGQRHRIWAIRDDDLIEALNAAWGPTRALIADGHHRYAAYLENQATVPDGPADFGLAMLVDEGDTPLRIGAIHRVLMETSISRFRAAIAGRHQIVDRDRATAVAALAPDTVVVTDGRRWGTIALSLSSATSAVEEVDQTLIPLLPKAPRRIHYEHSIDLALTRAQRARAVVIILPALTIEQVWRTVDRGRLLPEKATSFQPKPHPGAFIRSLLDAQPVH